MKLKLSLLLLLSCMNLYSQYTFYSIEGSNLSVEETIQSIDGGYIIVSTKSCYTPGETTIEGCGNTIYTVKTNSVGDTIWTNSISGFFTHLEPDIRVFENNDGSITIFSQRQKTTSCNGFPSQSPYTSWYRIDIMNIDANGNFINWLHLTDNCGLSYTDIKHLDDDTYLIVGNYSEYISYLNDPNYYYSGRVILINKNGETLRQYSDPYELWRSGKIISNNSDEIALIHMRGTSQLVLTTLDSEFNLVSRITSVENFPHCLDYRNCVIVQAKLNESNEIILFSKSLGSTIEDHVFTKVSSNLENIVNQRELSLSRATRYAETSTGEFLVGESFGNFNVYRSIKVTKINSDFLEVDSVLIDSEQDIRLESIIPLGDGTIQLAGTYNCCNNTDEPAKAFILLEDNLISKVRQERGAFQINVYPNPAENELMIKYQNRGNVVRKNHTHYQIINGLGQLIMNEKIENNQTLIDIKFLCKGIYYLRITDESGEILRIEKLIKL